MLEFDFLKPSKRNVKTGIEVYPKFVIRASKDLMIRGGDFYAIWNENSNLWSTDEDVATHLIDRILDNYAEELSKHTEEHIKVMHLQDGDTGMYDKWHHYCTKQMRSSYHSLDERLIFSNTDIKKSDYASKKLPYALEEGDISAYDELMSVLYSPEERMKIEWAIGSIVTGASVNLQKFIVMYGSAGTGKSTVLNIIQDLFDGYYCVFDAKALGSANSSFALEPFKDNPLVAIQHDGDLSRIEDNTRLNSVVSHESMTVNEKFKSAYTNRFKCFLFMGTNRPVKITDAKSGILRRLIDVSPSGNKVSPKRYKELVNNIKFELGAIAYHCKTVFEENMDIYDTYVPVAMMGASNDFYNYVLDSYYVFKKENGTTLKAAWEMYKTYCDDAKVPYPYSQRVFKEELKNYFKDYKERYTLSDGTRVRSYFIGFIDDKFEDNEVEEESYKIQFSDAYYDIPCEFDKLCQYCKAQLATTDGKPRMKWDSVKTKLRDIDTSEVHYVKPPLNHIVIDFDIPDETGKKCFAKNLEAASKWPRTYAELSKSGEGIHLHYIYTGDPEKLSRVYDDHIEIKVFSGNSSLRRKLTKCNDLPVATISSGLPLKGEKMVNLDTVKSEKGLRSLIKRNLNKEIHPGTKPSIDFIYKILEDAYNSGLKYDVTDMRQSILAFAVNSTHQANYCIGLVKKMKFKSDEPSVVKDSNDKRLIFFDCEVFPNLFLVNWKVEGLEKKIVRMINPSPAEIEDLMKLRLVGFNNRRYDNHILYARLLGYTNEELYRLSQRIVSGSKEAFFSEAYNISYTDIYDFSSKKQSLKKFEIELGIHHQELGLPWDQPVPEEMWNKVAEYCDNDVIATEAVFNKRKSDFVAREILADVAGMTANDTTNSLTTRIIFGSNRKPQSQFNYRFMGSEHPPFDLTNEQYSEFDELGRPLFPGYIYDHGKSTYRGEVVGEGGYVYAEPGIHTNVALLDIASMHPSSIVAENLFGDEYTQRFKDILDARIAIKHKDFDQARKMLGGKLGKYLDDPDAAKDLAQALKIAINSVYGLTAANFENPFRDIRNVDNIVAKRGALFMINLKHEVQARGFTVAHIKTDSIKIPGATLEIINYVYEYGKKYGYTFEHEATYDRMCLVNDAVYVAKYLNQEDCSRQYGYIPEKNQDHPNEWTATGTQFQVPYVFKTLFSKEPIEFSDMCEAKTVSKGLLYLDMNEGYPDVTDLEKRRDKLLKASKEQTPALDELEAEIATGHNYIFVGRVGQFCPIKPDCGGGVLYRENDGKYFAVTGTKGYRWLESEMVKTLEKENDIDKSYYAELVDDAVDTISKYGDFEQFVSDDPYISENFMNKPE